MRAAALWAGLALLAGCGTTGPGFELMAQTTLPSFDCADEELSSTIAPLRGRLLGNTGAPAAGTVVQLDATPRGLVRVFDASAVEAVGPPNGEAPWEDLLVAGQIWADFTGAVDTTNSAPIAEVTTSSIGAVDAWVHVDLVRICEEALPFDGVAVVTLSAGTLRQEFALTYAGQE